LRANLAEIHRLAMSVVSGAMIALPGMRRFQYFKRALGNWGISGIVGHLERQPPTHAPLDSRRRSTVHRSQPAIWELLKGNRHLFWRSNSNSGEKPRAFNAETQVTSLIAAHTDHAR
jgi:hypothetical protein